MPSKDQSPDKIHLDRAQGLHDHIFTHPDLESSLRNNPTAILDIMSDFRKSNHLMTFQQAKIDVARSAIEARTKPDTRPRTIVELGTYVGHSALAWVCMLRDWHLSSEWDSCKVVTMEASPAIGKIASDIFDLAGVGSMVEIMVGNSSDSLRSLESSHESIGQIDMLFLDHWEKFYLPDLKICEEMRLLREGTIIIADNTDFPGAPDYLEYMRGEGENGWTYQTETLDTIGERGKANKVEVSVIVGTR